MAELLGLELTALPCIILFKSFKSTDYAIVSFKKMTIEQISQKMRSVFSLVNKAVSMKQNPIQVVVKTQSKDTRRQKNKSLIGGIRGFVGTTFKTVVETWITTEIK